MTDDQMEEIKRHFNVVAECLQYEIRVRAIPRLAGLLTDNRISTISAPDFGSSVRIYLSTGQNRAKDKRLKQLGVSSTESVDNFGD